MIIKNFPTNFTCTNKKLEAKLNEILLVAKSEITKGDDAHIVIPRMKREITEVVKAFCPTGHGGKRDNSCSPANAGSGKPNSEEGSSDSGSADATPSSNASTDTSVSDTISKILDELDDDDNDENDPENA